MAAECLVIASSTSPVMEVIKDRENGLLVDFFSSKQIVDRINEALDHPERMARTRTRARVMVVDRYDLKRNTLPSQLKLIDGLISRNHTSVMRNAVAVQSPIVSTVKYATVSRAVKQRGQNV